MDQRQDRIADDFRLMTKRVVIDLDGAASGVDRLGGIGRNDVQPRLRACKRRLGFEITSDQRLVGKHRPHLGGAEHVTKERGIEDGAGQDAYPPGR